MIAESNRYVVSDIIFEKVYYAGCVGDYLVATIRHLNLSYAVITNASHTYTIPIKTKIYVYLTY